MKDNLIFYPIFLNVILVFILYAKNTLDNRKAIKYKLFLILVDKKIIRIGKLII